MKIIELKSSNVKKLKAIELKIGDDKNLIMVTGKNAQGKSSLIDSIWYALGGKQNIPDKPIRNGEDKGEIVVNVDGWIVTRTFTEKGSYLKVTNKDGELYSNPQEFLNFIVGNLSFDPLAFSRLESKKQIAELIKVSGVNFNDLDEKKAKLTEERTFISRELKTIAKHDTETIESAMKNKDNVEISVKELSDKLQKEVQIRNNFQHAQEQINLVKNNIEQAEKEIEELQKNIESYKGRIKEMELIKDTDKNIEELTNQLSVAEETNKTIRTDRNILDDHAKYTEKEANYKILTEAIKLTDGEKTKRLSEAKMPIEGLSWNEDAVLFNNIPFNQLSGAEQLKVSMAIAMASNPKLRVILIRDGSLLDQDNLKVIEEMAKDKDWQVWLEAISDTKNVGIVITDGLITANNYENQ